MSSKVLIEANRYNKDEDQTLEKLISEDFLTTLKTNSYVDRGSFLEHLFDYSHTFYFFNPDE